MDKTLERNRVTFKTVSGKSNSVSLEMVNPRNKTSLSTILSNYDLKDIYNADEFGLYHLFFPDKTYHLKIEKCFGGKDSKFRISGIASANAVDEKPPVFVIGKTKNPYCFKNVKALPCRYRSRRKSWMDGISFDELIRELNHKFASSWIHIAVLVDNRPAHPMIDNLKAMGLSFLPQNAAIIL